MEPSGPYGGRPSERELGWWRQLAVADDAGARKALFERYQGLALQIAASIFVNRRDRSIDFGEYMQYARVGLIEAINRYDPARNVNFNSFASHRIRGSILNGVCRLTEKAAQQARRQEILRERSRSLAGAQGEDKSSKEDVFGEMMNVAIGLALGYVLEDSGIWRADDERSDANPYRAVELKRMVERLRLVVEALPEREKMVIVRHYFEHEEFGAIGVTLGLSKARVSQVHARAIELLREAYGVVKDLDLAM